MINRLADFDGLDVSPLALAEKLVTVGLWERTETGYMIHDYLVYNPSREHVEKKRAEARERMATRRRGADGTFGDCSQEVRANNAETSQNVQPPPSPSPSPITTTTTARTSAPHTDPVVKELFDLLDDAGVRIRGDMMRDDYLDLLEITSDSTLVFDAIRDVVENLGDPSPKLLRTVVETCVREKRRPGQRAAPRASPDPPPKPNPTGPIRILNPNTGEIEVINGPDNARGRQPTAPG